MWVGKFAIIAWLFSSVMFFVGYMMETGMGVELFTGATQDSLETMIDANQETVDEEGQLNPTEIFSQFTAGGSVLFGIVTGGIISDMIGQLPMVNEAIMLLIRFLYSFSSAILFVNIITGRDI